MSDSIEFTKRTNTTRRPYIGHTDLIEHVVARGTCPYCGHKTGFRQVSKSTRSGLYDRMVALACEACESILSCSINRKEIYPSPLPGGIDDLPELIDKYYQEARRCLKANAPNGAVTLFRKIIHAIGIHYGIAEVDENKSPFKIINELYDQGEINEKLRESLLAAKDIGNDGAHINENEPNMEQAIATKGLIDSVLDSTVIQDQRLDFARSERPNEFEGE